MTSFDPQAIEDEAARLGVNQAEFCRRAGIRPSTWQRWKQERFEPRAASQRKVEDALAKLRSERGEAGRGADPPPHPDSAAPQGG